MMSSETHDWYDAAAFPELRDTPPWVMEDMITAQASIPGRLEGALGDAVPHLAETLRNVVRAGQPIVVTGVGTAGHAARAVTMLINEAVSGSAVTAGPAEARESSDQALVPREGGLCIAVSHGGRSRSTVAALSAARDSGASTALITAAEGTPARQAADISLVTPLEDASFCHTVGYLSPILAGMYVSSAYRGTAFPEGPVTAYLRQLQAIEAAASAVAAKLGDARRLVAAGSLVDAPTARELALKVAEGARLPTTALGVEDALHGHLVGHDRDSALVAVVTGDTGATQSAHRAQELLRSARRIGIQTAAIVSSPLDDVVDVENASAGRLVLPPAEGIADSWASLISGALGLQHLTVGLVHVHGVNPDLIRREQRAYREAVEVAGTKVRQQ